MLPPKPLKLSEVVKYLADKHQIDVTRMTVYNWTRKGKKGHKLETFASKTGEARTTERAVDEFIANIA